MVMAWSSIETDADGERLVVLGRLARPERKFGLLVERLLPNAGFQLLVWPRFLIFLANNRFQDFRPAPGRLARPERKFLLEANGT